MYDVPNADDRIETVLRQVGLWGRQRDPVRTYSRGMQQRLAIARAMLHEPPILLLDEPDTGLDQHAAAMLSELLHEVGATRRTVLMTTHNLERGLALGDRVAILAGGRITYQASKSDLDTERFRKVSCGHRGRRTKVGLRHFALAADQCYFANGDWLRIAPGRGG
jgi:heme exporter protein A